MSVPLSQQEKDDVNRLIVELNQLTFPPIGGGSICYRLNRVLRALKSPTRTITVDDILRQPLATTLEVLKDLLFDFGQPPAVVPGPVLIHTNITDVHRADGELNFACTQRYNGSLSDPEGATTVQVELGLREWPDGEYEWKPYGRGAWTLEIGGDPVSFSDQFACILTSMVALRFRFSNDQNEALSDWSYSDEWPVTGFPA